MTFPEQVARLARDLPALEYARNAWGAVRAHFPGAVGMDESEHIISCIAKLRAENAGLREALVKIERTTCIIDAHLISRAALKP